MYVADVTDVQELLELLAEAQDRLAYAEIRPGSELAYEQAMWDIEDIEERLWELGSK